MTIRVKVIKRTIARNLRFQMELFSRPDLGTVAMSSKYDVSEDSRRFLWVCFPRSLRELDLIFDCGGARNTCPAVEWSKHINPNFAGLRSSCLCIVDGPCEFLGCAAAEMGAAQGILCQCLCSCDCYVQDTPTCQQNATPLSTPDTSLANHFKNASVIVMP